MVTKRMDKLCGGWVFMCVRGSLDLLCSVSSTFNMNLAMTSTLSTHIIGTRHFR